MLGGIYNDSVRQKPRPSIAANLVTKSGGSWNPTSRFESYFPRVYSVTQSFRTSIFFICKIVILIIITARKKA